MPQTTAPITTPSPIKGEKQTRVGTNTRQLFAMTTLNLSWQMAVVVLAPIIIGNKLDIAWHTKPWLTLVGFIVAVVGTVYVIKSTVARADRAMADQEKHD